MSVSLHFSKLKILKIAFRDFGNIKKCFTIADVVADKKERMGKCEVTAR